MGFCKKQARQYIRFLEMLLQSRADILAVVFGGNNPSEKKWKATAGKQFPEIADVLPVWTLHNAESELPTLYER